MHDHGTARSSVDTGKGRSTSPLLACSVVLASTYSVAAMADAIVTVRNLSVTGMIAEADPLVKTVMLILLMASITTWTIFIAKHLELRTARRLLKLDLDMLDRVASLSDAAAAAYPATATMVEVASRELRRMKRPSNASLLGSVQERVSARLGVVETQAGQSVLTGVNVLASIGALSPFIGLAGTVWGIMNSFIGISKSHATNLAVVAPGIAEALLATALGLIAAIPAVLVYNLLTRSIARYRRMVSEIAVGVACLVSRDLDTIRELGSGSRTPPSTNE